ncbi:hypothetical protein [Tianweitania sediminis]|uniref:Uncharacterized protein n=1 Tax=Tianweitania sediminis TaxID=1502156 RepID=A0A8J7R086_9HYPH|nr:hypothetical protein [Tianweitania sediminis]MBP0437536.1 hypothetical protein [Tianweitania sediminis]
MEDKRKASQDDSRSGSRQEGASSASSPDVTGQENLTTIQSVDLSLHGDGISHWQDEPDAGGAAKQPQKKNDK